jgi:hypothetical protein
MDCDAVARCDLAKAVGVAGVAGGYTCEDWRLAPLATVDARKSTVSQLDEVAIQAILDVPTDAIFKENQMSQTEERQAELQKFGRPKLKNILVEHFSGLEGKSLRAALDLAWPDSTWPDNDDDARKAAKKKAIRTLPEQMIEAILALEFPDAPEAAEEKPKRTRRARKKKEEEAPEEDTAKASSDASPASDLAPTINGLADAVEKQGKQIDELCRAITAIGKQLFAYLELDGEVVALEDVGSYGPEDEG